MKLFSSYKTRRFRIKLIKIKNGNIKMQRILFSCATLVTTQTHITEAIRIGRLAESEKNDYEYG